MKYFGRIFAVATLLALLLVFPAPAQEKLIGKDRSRQLPFAPSEQLVYEGEFTRALLRGINIADLRFKVSRTVAQPTAQTDDASSKDYLQFTAEVESKGILTKLFGLHFRQLIESKVEPDTFYVLQTTKQDVQGSRRRTSEAAFDYQTGEVVYKEVDPNDPNRPPRIVTSKIEGAVQDIASAFYFLRTQPLIPGKHLEILVSDTGQVYHIPVRVIAREQLKTVLGKVQTVRVQPEMFGEDRLIRGKGEITIWFTDDARHIPVRAKIKSEMGRLDIKLKSISNGS